MEALADDPAVFHDDGTNHRIRANRPPTLRRKAKGQSHVVEILWEAGHRFLRATRDRLRVVRADFVDFAREGEVDAADFFESAATKAA